MTFLQALAMVVSGAAIGAMLGALAQVLYLTHRRHKPQSHSAYLQLHQPTDRWLARCTCGWSYNDTSYTQAQAEVRYHMEAHKPSIFTQ